MSFTVMMSQTHSRSKKYCTDNKEAEEQKEQKNFPKKKKNRKIVAHDNLTFKMRQKMTCRFPEE